MILDIEEFLDPLPDVDDDDVDFQAIAVAVIFTAWVDSGAVSGHLSRMALAFSQSIHWRLWAILGDISDEAAERIRLDIERRATAAADRNKRYADVRRLTRHARMELAA